MSWCNALMKSGSVARVLCISALCLLPAACGYQLRGDVVIPFNAIHIDAPAGSPIAADLTRKLQLASTKLAASVAPSANSNDARLVISVDSRDKIILSLSGAGRVREFQLKLRVAFQLIDAKGEVLIPTSEVNLTRIMSFDDAFVLAKQKEEALLYRDMEAEVVQQILRRLSQVKRAS